MGGGWIIANLDEIEEQGLCEAVGPLGMVATDNSTVLTPIAVKPDAFACAGCAITN